MATETADERRPNPFVGPDVLDPLFQRMRACGLAPREVQERILAALKREELVILRHVAAGTWSREPRQFATREEAAQAEQAARAARRRWDHNAANAIVYEQSPSPDGIIEPIVPEIWGVTVILAIRDEHLVIEFLDPTFPPESYSFDIASPETDKLLAAVFPEHALPAKDRIAAQAQQLKRDGVSEGITKTGFAKLLADRVGVSWKYVRNHLTEWGLWPISDIE